MRILNISILLLMFLMLSCDKEKNIYPESDKDNKNDSDTSFTDEDTAKSDEGGPCKLSSDCLPHLKCVDDICVLDVVDEDVDKIVPDEEPDDVPDVIDVDNNDTDPGDTDIDDGGDELPDVDIIPYGCNNGIKEPGEECDNGTFNSDLPGDIGETCRTTCKYAGCGDSIVDIGESCDDGNKTGGDYCNETCTVSNGKCGDGVVQANEACDKLPAGQGIGSYCADDCMSIAGSCGDGVQQDNEACDKAETGVGIGPYYCAADCKTIIGSCGDQTQQANETCDDGENNGRYNYCNATCNGRSSYCGDGVKDYGYEECDDGNDSDNDYCTTDCMTELGRCGDGVIQGNEACDNAVFGAGIGAYCSSDCQTLLGYCGDETVQTNEQCDWGSKNGGVFCEYGIEGSCNKCNSVCNFVPGESTFCGDGKVDTSNGETCDKAEFGSGIGGYCSFDCKTSSGYCGDGAVQPNEACDKAVFGDGTGPEYCSNDCKNVTGYCGDGTEQASMEECDNGAGNSDDCAYGETSCTVCNTQCKETAGVTSYCGDSRTDTLNSEYCDSGSNNGKYKASYPGYCNSDCLAMGGAGYCGDETIQGSYEQCDDGADNGNLNCAYGLTSCEVCTAGCATASGSARYCGDGVISDGEICDSGDNNGLYGYCKSDCTGMGEYCGDSITNGTENCDDGDLNGTYGKCAFDCSGPGVRCGDGIKQQEEFCDDGTDNGTYRLNGPGNCDADCQGVGEGGYCGNGTEELSNEECDHNGVILTDCEYGQTSCVVCSSSCEEIPGKTAYCGDSVVNGAETCDSGPNNGQYGYCNSTCTALGERCGDGIKNGTESCDDGENNGLYGFCKADCSGDGPYCGDSDINGTESCDNGLNNGLYGYCKADCSGLGERCGDGTVNGSEVCDSGSDNGEYGHCNSGCTAMGPYCGDDDINGPEICDDGENNGNYGFCNSDCTGINDFCGDGIVNNGEVCDDGEFNGTYGKCNTSCTGPGLRCGDGAKQPEEQCDDGVNNGTYRLNAPGYCNSDCQGTGLAGYCGDGGKQSTEVCDDGGLNGTYGKCKTDCTGIGERCGDGIVNGTETCDDGEQNGNQGYCNVTCTGDVEYCGDGIKNGVEQCDNGSNNGQTTCPYGVTSCKVCSTQCIESDGLTSYCGNSKTDSVNGEICDQGSNNGKYKANAPGYCNSDCKGQGAGGYCGDTIKQSTYEGCDNGVNNGAIYCDYGLTSCNVCTTTCTNTAGIARYCGDGIKQDEELCDDGSNNGAYSAVAPGYCNTGCQGTGAGGYCGDGTKNGTESCDSGANNGQYGFCKMDCSGLGERCGDEIVNGTETCDEGGLNGEVGHCNQYCNGINDGSCGDGIIAGEEVCDDGENNGVNGYCNTECTGDVEYCGDGITNGSEVCDHGVNNGQPGYCLSDCSAVDIYCGNGVVQTGELCDEGPNNGLYDPAGTGYCNSDCNGYAEGGFCGDNVTQPAEEDCDDGGNNGLPGYCEADCTTASDCGDNVIGSGEFCDTANVNCNEMDQFSSGVVACPEDCGIPVMTLCEENLSYVSPFFTSSQTDCYNNTTVITCPDEGDLFYGQEPQFNHEEPAFTVNSETIYDDVTGLTWQKSTPSTYSGCTQGDPAGSRCTVAEAWSYCDTLSMGGYEDWRLPAVYELNALLDLERPAPVIRPDFTNTAVSGNYWSAGMGYYLTSMSDGTVAKADKSSSGYVKCVRGEQLFAESEIIIDGNLYADILDPVSFKAVFWQYDDTNPSMNWEDALDHCSNITESGISGFRLPSYNELLWFVNESIYADPDLISSGSFWTSTTVYSIPSEAYSVDFATGSVETAAKTGSAYVICVK